MKPTAIRKILKLNRPHLFLLENCSDMKELMKFHCQIITNGLANNTTFLSALLSFAAVSSAGDMAYAHSLFDRIDFPNLFMFNTMIRGYAWSSSPRKAFSLYVHMLRFGLLPNGYTFPFLIKASSRMTTPTNGETIHGPIIKLGHGLEIYVLNALMHMYGNFGFSEAVVKLFAEIPEPDVVSWNVVIDSFARSGCLNEALVAFDEMCWHKVEPNSITMLGVLFACSKSGNLVLGKLIHLYMVKKDLQISMNLGNGLLDMYAKFGDMDSAGKLFNRIRAKTAFAWTSMIDGHARTGEVERARSLFDQMPDRDTTSWNVMLNGLIRAGDMDSADQFFEEIPEKDLVSWNSMIVGYGQNKKFVKALKLFREMLASGLKPDRITLVNMFFLCGSIGALHHGEVIHSFTEKQNLKVEEVTVALMDMYCKCGTIEKAIKIFHGIAQKTVLAWTAMIVGLAMNGLAEDALKFFSQMQTTGIRPNEITFIGVLCACSYAGLVEEGCRFFSAISQVYNIKPRSEHYGCMVDILGRAGLLKEAEIFIQNMPIEPDSGVLGALFGACRIHGELRIGEKVAKILTELEPYDSGRYVLLSNMYAMEKRWGDVVKVRDSMKVRGVKKKPGFSLIELQGEIHQFFAGDRSHPDAEEIYSTLEEITVRIKDAGYEPDRAQVF